MTALIVAIVIVVIIIAVKGNASSGGKAVNARIRGYGVVVDGDQVKSGAQIAGPLGGAHAEVTDATSRHTLTRTVTVAGAMTKKTSAYMVITCANGYARQVKLDGAATVRTAQAWAIRFNAIAAAPWQPDLAVAETAPQPGRSGDGPKIDAPPASEFGPEYESREARIARFRAEHPSA